MFCLIVSIFVVLVSGTTPTYHVAIVGFLAAGLILTSSSVNDLIYSSNSAKEVAAAGTTVTVGAAGAARRSLAVQAL